MPFVLQNFVCKIYPKKKTHTHTRRPFDKGAAAAPKQVCCETRFSLYSSEKLTPSIQSNLFPYLRTVAFSLFFFASWNMHWWNPIFYSFSKKQYLHPQLVFTQLINKDKSTPPPMADGHGRVVFGLI